MHSRHTNLFLTQISFQGYKYILIANQFFRALTPSETTSSYAKIKGLSHHSHKIKIFASNSEGHSKVPSIITIPSHGSRECSSKHYQESLLKYLFSVISEPLTFTKIEFGGGVYELSWKEPLKAKNIANYTIFWCDSDRDRPYQCTVKF